MENKKIIIALVEDKLVNQRMFAQKVEYMGDCKIAFIAANGYECLHELKGLQPDKMPSVIFVDLEMPQMNGVQTIALARSLYPEIHYLVFTVFDDDDKIFEAIKVGASGYLLKHEPATVLEEAVKSVLDIGGAPMSPAIARKALSLLSKSSLDKNIVTISVSSIPSAITEREKEILKMMVNGWDAKRIAIDTHLSVLTVRKHIANIYDKLHIHSKAQAISLAHKQRWFE